ncbi:unnamed protein product [Musa acuminata var. zebrina]
MQLICRMKESTVKFVSVCIENKDAATYPPSTARASPNPQTYISCGQLRLDKMKT